MSALQRTRAIARKELTVLLRDRLYLFMAVVLPLFTMLIMGYGLSYDVRGLLLGIADLDHSPESHRFVDAFAVSGYFRPVVSTARPEVLEDALLAGRIRVGITIPSGFAKALHGGRPVEVQVLVDASFPSRAEIARGYAEAIVGRFNQQQLSEAALRRPALAASLAPRLDVVNRVWFNPTLESKNFLAPGLLVVSLLFWTPLLISLSVTREKETGAILNVQTAPLARWEYVVGKLAPYAGVSFLSYWLLLAAAVGIFKVPLRGDLLLLTLSIIAYVIAMTGAGLLVSLLVRTQVAALLVTGTVVMTVGLFYSGWLEPVTTLGRTGQIVSRLLPTAALVGVTRGVFLKGLGFREYGGTLLGLAGYAAAFVALPILAFRKRRR